jgi:hypothetical protein
MAKIGTMYNYIDKYIKEFSTEKTKDVYNQLRVFLYMGVSHKQNKSLELYKNGQELFAENVKNNEFRELVIGCLGNMKRVYGNSEEYNFDEIYKDITGNKSSNLDFDFARIPNRYNRKPSEFEM